MRVSRRNFNERCYELVRKVPKGKVTTYAEVARALGTRAYRAVGNAMAKSPGMPQVPCHRVVRSDGKTGGFALGTKKKIQMLAKEGVKVRNGKINLEKYFFKLR
ncbi:MGMT family protein [Candidatus Pacearchaeota archaeon]|nr:MAG: MGMT family protein [Candidatus Pacearchaeota archaeon]